MDSSICTRTMNMFTGDQTCQKSIVNQKSKKSVWDGYWQLLGTISEFALETLRYGNDPEPLFSNGGTRVLIRLDRIDLI